MIAIVQRVNRASVVVDGRTVGEIGRGLIVLLGVHRLDTEREAAWVAERVAKLRVFADEAGKMNLSMAQAKGACLVVPNFTLVAEASRGARPSFSEAMAPEGARVLWERVCEGVAAAGEGGVRVERGEFGADMRVSLENDGPVTIVIDSAGMPRAG